MRKGAVKGIKTAHVAVLLIVLGTAAYVVGNPNFKINLANLTNFTPEISPKYYSDPLYCQFDVDCVMQPTCSCSCPKAVNRYNLKDFQCQPVVGCPTSCRPEIPKCVLYSCTTVIGRID